MHNSNITVLIVEDDIDVRALLAAVAMPIAHVICATTVRDALVMLPQADVLVLDWMLGDQTSESVLDEWVCGNGGPCTVLSGVLSDNAMRLLYAKGVHHALTKPITIDMFTSILRMYVRYVEQARSVSILMDEIKKLRRNMIILALMLAAVAGPEIIGYAKALLLI